MLENQKISFLLKEALEKRRVDGLLRQLKPALDPTKPDFISNDYLGLGRSSFKAEWMDAIPDFIPLGSGASRLVSGNEPILEKLEEICAQDLKAESCLFFPNGFMANLALLSCLGSRHDTYIYDEQCHVSLKDGMRLSLAGKKSFAHNQPEDLRKILQNLSGKGNRYVITESIFSMDGDICPLAEIVEVCQEMDAHLILDEAHSTGTIGKSGLGLALDKQLEGKIFCRIYTFGKALGAAGAILAGEKVLRDYVINFAHPFIYSTAPMPIQVAICQWQWKRFRQNPHPVRALQHVISVWNQKVLETGTKASTNLQSPVQFIPCSGNQEAKHLEKQLQSFDFQIKAMLSPTVSIGKERLRVSLHNYNSMEEIGQLMLAVKEIKNNFGPRI